MNGEIMIREAAPAEAGEVSSVLRESFLEYMSAYTDGGFSATTPGADKIESRMGEGPVWVALLDGAIVGTVAAVPRVDGLYMRSMAVLPGARGHGIGELLLERVERYGREQGCGRVYLSTTPFLDRAIRLYERWGFVRDDAGPHDLFGTLLFTMVKTLKQA
jgi:GNAT superfamily N-acetyltransferase